MKVKIKGRKKYWNFFLKEENHIFSFKNRPSVLLDEGWFYFTKENTYNLKLCDSGFRINILHFQNDSWFWIPAKLTLEKILFQNGIFENYTKTNKKRK